MEGTETEKNRGYAHIEFFCKNQQVCGPVVIASASEAILNLHINSEFEIATLPSGARDDEVFHKYFSVHSVV